MIHTTDFLYGGYTVPALDEQYILPVNLWPDFQKLSTPLDMRAAFAFERKDYVSLDELGRERNPSYSSSEDPILIQATWLTQVNDDPWLKLKIAHNKALSEAKEAKRQTLLAEQARIIKELEELG